MGVGTNRNGTLTSAALLMVLAALLPSSCASSCGGLDVGFARDASGERTVDAALNRWAKLSPDLPPAGWKKTSRTTSSGTTRVAMEQDGWTVSVWISVAAGWSRALRTARDP